MGGAKMPCLYLPEIHSGRVRYQRGFHSGRWVRYGHLLHWLALEQCPWTVGWEADILLLA